MSRPPSGRSSECSPPVLSNARGQRATPVRTSIGLQAPARHVEKSSKQDPKNASLAVEEERVVPPAEIDAAFQKLFQAYDLDESGEVSLREYLKLHIRQSYLNGDVFEAGTALAWMSTAKRSDADDEEPCKLDLARFQDHQLNWYKTSTGIRTLADVVKRALGDADQIIKIRGMMGARYDLGLREDLKAVFELINVSGDGQLKPAEWLLAQKQLQPVMFARRYHQLDDAWMGEAAFVRGDKHHDGVLLLKDFLALSIEALEKEFDNVRDCMDVVKLVKASLHGRDRQEVELTDPVNVYVPFKATPTFYPPTMALDFSTAKGKDYKKMEGVRLPQGLSRVDDLASILRMHLHMMSTVVFSTVFCSGSKPRAESVSGSKKADRLESPSADISRQSSACSLFAEDDTTPYVALMTAGKNLYEEETMRKGSIAAALACLAEPVKAGRGFYLKNIRPKAQRLSLQSTTSISDCPEFAAKLAKGAQWGINWETQLLGTGTKLPTPVMLSQGDMLLIEVPQTCPDGGDGVYKYSSNVYMDSPGVLSYPRTMDVVEKKPKKAKPKANHNTSTLGAARASLQRSSRMASPSPADQNVPKSSGAETGAAAGQADRRGSRSSLPGQPRAEEAAMPPMWIVLHAQRTGTSRVCIEVSWEGAEDALAEDYGNTRPLAIDSIARIGPLEVEVRKPQAESKSHSWRHPARHQKQEPKQRWWNGTTWVSRRDLLKMNKRTQKRLSLMALEGKGRRSVRRRSRKRSLPPAGRASWSRPQSALSTVSAASVASGVSSSEDTVEERTTSRPMSAGFIRKSRLSRGFFDLLGDGKVAPPTPAGPKPKGGRPASAGTTLQRAGSPTETSQSEVSFASTPQQQASDQATPMQPRPPSAKRAAIGYRRPASAPGGGRAVVATSAQGSEADPDRAGAAPSSWQPQDAGRPSSAPGGGRNVPIPNWGISVTSANGGQADSVLVPQVPPAGPAGLPPRPSSATVSRSPTFAASLRETAAALQDAGTSAVPHPPMDSPPSQVSGLPPRPSSAVGPRAARTLAVSKVFVRSAAQEDKDEAEPAPASLVGG